MKITKILEYTGEYNNDYAVKSSLSTRASTYLCKEGLEDFLNNFKIKVPRKPFSITISTDKINNKSRVMFVKKSDRTNIYCRSGNGTCFRFEASPSYITRVAKIDKRPKKLYLTVEEIK